MILTDGFGGLCSLELKIQDKVGVLLETIGLELDLRNNWMKLENSEIWKGRHGDLGAPQDELGLVLQEFGGIV